MRLVPAPKLVDLVAAVMQGGGCGGEEAGIIARRRAAWQRPAPKFERGFGALYQQHITQADHGCDFDFLEGTAPTPDPEIH